MSEEPPVVNNDDENFPEIPDDISAMVDGIYDREEQRRKAVEILLDRAMDSPSREERDRLMLKASEFGDILEEFRGQFPELFPDDKP